MPTRLLLEGTDIETLLAQVREEHGSAAKIISADKVRSGGFAGFFARQRYELSVEIDDETGSAPHGGLSGHTVPAGHSMPTSLVMPDSHSFPGAPAPAARPTAITGPAPVAIPLSVAAHGAEPSMASVQALLDLADAREDLLSRAVAGRTDLTATAPVSQPTPPPPPAPARSVGPIAPIGAPTAVTAASAVSGVSAATSAGSTTPALAGHAMPPQARSAAVVLSTDSPLPSTSGTDFAEVLAGLRASLGAAQPEPSAASVRPYRPAASDAPIPSMMSSASTTASTAFAPSPAVAPFAVEPLTIEPVSIEPVSVAAASTASPASTAAVSFSPATAAPTTAAPYTAAPTTAAHESAVPGSAAPVSAAPASAVPVSSAPASAVPVSSAPASAVPVSSAPTEDQPIARPAVPTFEPAFATAAAPPAQADRTAAPSRTAPATATPRMTAGGAPAAASDEPLARGLAELGVPEKVLSHAVGRDPYNAIVRALGMLPGPAAPPTAPGDVLVIAGELAGALKVAQQAARRMRIDAANILVVGPAMAGTGVPASRRMSGPTEAQKRAPKLHEADVPHVVVVDAPIDGENGDWVRSVAKALDATAVWALVDATRKTQDVAHYLRGLGLVDAIAIHGTAATGDPASVLSLGVPVALLDGRRATPQAWAALLCDRLNQAPDLSI